MSQSDSKGMAFVHLFCDGKPFIQQRNMPILIDLDKAVQTQIFHSDAYAGLGIGKLGCNIDRPDLPVSFLKDKDRFQIILCGFMNMQFLYHPAFQKKYTV